jgi:hypothetical protein
MDAHLGGSRDSSWRIDNAQDEASMRDTRRLRSKSSDGREGCQPMPPAIH